MADVILCRQQEQEDQDQCPAREQREGGVAAVLLATEEFGQFVDCKERNRVRSCFYFRGNDVPFLIEKDI